MINVSMTLSLKHFIEQSGTSLKGDSRWMDVDESTSGSDNIHKHKLSCVHPILLVTTSVSYFMK